MRRVAAVVIPPAVIPPVVVIPLVEAAGIRAEATTKPEVLTMLVK